MAGELASFRFSRMWSSRYFLAGEELAGQKYEMIKARGQEDSGKGGPLGFTDTSFREGGRIPRGQSARVFDVTAELQGSGQGSPLLEGVLYFSFDNMLWAVGPLGSFIWNEAETRGYVRLDSFSGHGVDVGGEFSMLLSFGPDVRPLPYAGIRNVRLRLTFGCLFPRVVEVGSEARDEPVFPR